jgi:hypothetical protein
MRVSVIERNGVRIVVCAEPLARVEDALGLVTACIENEASLLLEASDLPPAFFELRSGFAGELLQKLQNYRIRLAGVFPPDAAHGPRFAEFVSEARRGRGFRVFAERADALAWLAGEEGGAGASATPALTGACLCGAVRFAITGKVGPLGYCHCSLCRRSSGSAFGAAVSVRARYLTWLAGRDAVTEYESSPGKVRAFCGTCGSPVYSRREDEPETFRIRLGLVDGDPGRRALAHFWVSARAPWHEISDALPQYPEGSVVDGSEGGA